MRATAGSPGAGRGGGVTRPVQGAGGRLRGRHRGPAPAAADRCVCLWSAWGARGPRRARRVTEVENLPQPAQSNQINAVDAARRPAPSPEHTDASAPPRPAHRPPPPSPPAHRRRRRRQHTARVSSGDRDGRSGGDSRGPPCGQTNAPPPPRYGMVPSDVPSCRGATITALAPPSTRPRARSPALWRPPLAPAASPPRDGRDDNSWRRQRQQAAAQTTRFGDAARPPYVQSSRLARTFEQVSAVAPTAAPMVRPASWRV